MRLAAPQEITFDELVKAAAELGMVREDLQEAERQYAQNSSEAGQRREFRAMQRDELKTWAIYLAVGVALITLIGWSIELVFALWTFPIACVLAALVFLCMASSKLDEGSSDYRKKFEAWVAKKEVWLRPERASEIVQETIHHELYMGESARAARKALQKRMGYDRRRAKQVFAAYVRENPELEVRYPHAGL